MTRKHSSPDYYTWHPSGVECIDIIEYFNFNIGNAIKYLWRHGRKDSKLSDLRKARYYIAREIERLESNEETPVC